jgi:hypothetical protein
MFTFPRSICVFALTATGLFAQTVSAPLVQETLTTGMVGIAEGQTARLNTLNPGVAPPAIGVVCSALLNFINGQGTVLKTAVVSVSPGKNAWLDLFSDRDLGLAADERTQIRATITVPPILPPAGSTASLPPPCSLIGTLEIFDTLSGKTQVVLGGTHLVPNPVAVPTAATGSAN